MRLLDPVGPPSIAHSPGDLVLGAIVLILILYPAVILIRRLIKESRDDVSR